MGFYLILTLLPYKSVILNLFGKMFSVEAKKMGKLWVKQIFLEHEIAGCNSSLQVISVKTIFFFLAMF